MTVILIVCLSALLFLGALCGLLTKRCPRCDASISDADELCGACKRAASS